MLITSIIMKKMGKNERKHYCQQVVREGLLEEVASEQRPELTRGGALQH